MLGDETDDSATLLAAAAAAGIIGVTTLGLEVMTDRWLARVVGVAPFFMSTPLGLGTVGLGGWIASDTPRRALPILVLGLVYWSIVLVAW